MFGFYRMNAVTDVEKLATHHFNDMEKYAGVLAELKNSVDFLRESVN